MFGDVETIGHFVKKLLFNAKSPTLGEKTGIRPLNVLFERDTDDKDCSSEKGGSVP